MDCSRQSRVGSGCYNVLCCIFPSVETKNKSPHLYRGYMCVVPAILCKNRLNLVAQLAPERLAARQPCL